MRHVHVNKANDVLSHDLHCENEKKINFSFAHKKSVVDRNESVAWT